MPTYQNAIDLLRIVPASEDRVAVFDCDGTLIKGDIGEAMFYFQIEHFLFRESPASLWPDFPRHDELEALYESLIRFPPYVPDQDARFTSFADLLLSRYFNQLAQGKTEKACSDIVRLFAGFSSAEVQEIARDTVRREATAPMERCRLGSFTLPRGIRTIRESSELLSILQQAEYDVWVVSGSNRWSVEETCRPLGIPPGRVIGISLCEQNGILRNEVEKPVPLLDGKVAALRKAGVESPAIVISNSTFDIPLFLMSSGPKVLLQSDEDGRSFFQNLGVVPDGSWFIVEHPTVTD